MNQPLSDTTAIAARIEGRIDTAVTSQLGLSGVAGGLNLENMTQVMEVAKMMAISDIAVRKHLRNNPGACLAIVIQAFEWRLSPFAVANKSYAVNDQIAYESQLIQAVILQRAPIKGRIQFRFEGEGDARVCFASAQPSDGGEPVGYKSPPLGKITPKNSPLWKSDQDQQQAYYSGRALCRRHFPDVLLGIYDVDELEGSAGLRDVTPKPSGLADRLNKVEPQGGFSAAGVAETLAEPANPKSEPAKSDSEPSKSAPESSSQAPSHDPEVVRAGAQAFIDGETREAPSDFSDADKAAWLHGWEAAQAGAEGGAP